VVESGVEVWRGVVCGVCAADDAHGLQCPDGTSARPCVCRRVSAARGVTVRACCVSLCRDDKPVKSACDAAVIAEVRDLAASGIVMDSWELPRVVAVAVGALPALHVFMH
jgi:hypothetical protein